MERPLSTAARRSRPRAGAQVGDVLVHQLVLQVDGVGGDDHALVVGGRPEGGRQQVGKGLADAGAGFDHHVVAFIQGSGDRTEHVQLLGAAFKLRAAISAVEIFFKGAAVFQDSRNFILIQ